MLKFACVLFAVVAFTSCSDAPERETAANDAGLPAAQAPEPQAANANSFDKFLKDKLSRDDRKNLITSCNENTENVFCSSILNLEKLEEKLKIINQKNAYSVSGAGGSVRAHFTRKNKLLNWKELQGASLSALIRAFSNLRAAEISEIRHAVFRETDCPNSPAIALATTLEDHLPRRSILNELGRLYEKGADCIADNPADREQLLTRAGLFYFANKDFANAAQAFTKSSTIPETFAARALYWLYRTRTELGDRKRAQTSLEQLQTRYPFSFHTLVALTAASRDAGELLGKHSSTLIKRSVQAPAINQLIEQVEILHRCQLDESAAHVLNWAVAGSRDSEPEFKLYLAELKQDQGDYQSKITLLTDVLYKNPSLASRETMELYFPKVFFPIFEKHSSVVDPYLLLAIARRESAFNTRAISPANARGLMQLLPSTGRMMKIRPNLLDPEDNVEVGAKYVQTLLRRTKGQIHMALAAYNAGPQKIGTWTHRYPYEPILFIDLIPYRETREYVASVIRNYYWYRRIHLGDEKLTPRQLLELAITR